MYPQNDENAKNSKIREVAGADAGVDDGQIERCKKIIERFNLSYGTREVSRELNSHRTLLI